MAYPQLTDKAGVLATALAIRTRKISVAEAVDAAITRAGRDDAAIDALTEDLLQGKQPDELLTAFDTLAAHMDRAVMRQVLRIALSNRVACSLWLGNCEAGVPAALQTLERTVKAYADFTWRHMRAEEHELFPIAHAHLTRADWAAIAQAFTSHDDPLSGQTDAAAFSQLFHDIVRRTPAPLGLGPASVAGKAS